MMYDSNQIYAGRLEAFLSHSAPSCRPMPDEEVSIAEVE